MADNNDDQLIQDLRSFGEIVDKITDKNRSIMEKKLNHLRARKRQSEKFSQSMLVSKSPVKANKGRGKKNSKKVGPSETQAIEVDLQSDKMSDIGSTPPLKKFVKSVEPNVNTAVVVPSMESKPMATKRGRKSAMPSVVVTTADSKTQDTVAKATGKESNANLSKAKLPVGAAEKNKRGRRTVALNDGAGNTVLNEHQSDTMNVGQAQAAKRRTYSIDKLDSDKDSKGTSRIPKLARGKSATQESSGTAIVTAVNMTQSEIERSTTSTALQQQSSNYSTPTLQPSPELKTYLYDILPAEGVANIQIIDTAIGSAAAGVDVRLHRQDDEQSWRLLYQGTTDDKGFCSEIYKGFLLHSGVFRLRVDSGQYFQRSRRRCFNPFIDIVFNVDTDKDQALYVKPVNVQLLLGQFGFSANRTVF